jgi:hypothetical protein
MLYKLHIQFQWTEDGALGVVGDFALNLAVVEPKLGLDIVTTLLPFMGAATAVDRQRIMFSVTPTTVRVCSHIPGHRNVCYGRKVKVRFVDVQVFHIFR